MDPILLFRTQPVLPEYDVQHPVQAVLDMPVPAHRYPKQLRYRFDVALQQFFTGKVFFHLPAYAPMVSFQGKAVVSRACFMTASAVAFCVFIASAVTMHPLQSICFITFCIWGISLLFFDVCVLAVGHDTDKDIGFQYLACIRVNDRSRVTCPVNLNLLAWFPAGMHSCTVFLLILLNVVAELGIHETFPQAQHQCRLHQAARKCLSPWLS